MQNTLETVWYYLQFGVNYDILPEEWDILRRMERLHFWRQEDAKSIGLFVCNHMEDRGIQFLIVADNFRG
jgi:hypothetical protein